MNLAHDEKDAKGERELFEAWAKLVGFLTKRKGDDYDSQHTTDVWWAWQAGRADTARVVANNPVIDGLTCAGILTAEHEADPRKALSDLIGWEVAVALDPRVSPDAAKLVYEAVATARKADAQELEELAKRLHERGMPDDAVVTRRAAAVVRRARSAQPDAGEKP